MTKKPSKKTSKKKTRSRGERTVITRPETKTALRELAGVTDAQDLRELCEENARWRERNGR